MKATGIIRRIDDLGRVVVPKEIRRILKIREGDPMEIFTENGGIFLKKYSHMGSSIDEAQRYVKSLRGEIDNLIIVTDTDYVVAKSGNGFNGVVGKEIHDDIYKVISSRSPSVDVSLNIVNGEHIEAGLVYPIISEGDLAGSIIVVRKSSDETFKGTTLALVKVAADYLGNLHAE